MPPADLSPADPLADHQPPGAAVPALTLAGLPAWAARLALPDPLPDPGAAPAADAAGLQLLVATLLWVPGRLALDPADGSPAARLWQALGLDDPADARPILADGRVTALRRADALP